MANNNDIIRCDKDGVEYFTIIRSLNIFYSGTSAANAATKDEISIRRFLQSKSPIALLYKGFKSDTFVVENSKKELLVIHQR